MTKTTKSVSASTKKSGKSPSSKKTKSAGDTFVLVILDESGSMGHGKEITLSGFNEQVETIQKMAGTTKGVTKVSLVTFSDEPRVVFANTTVDRLKKLTDAEYQPMGSTALYDAIKDGVEVVRSDKGSEHKSAAVLVVIVTDGMENASRRFSASDVAEIKQSLEKTGRWTFTLMGPNQGLKEMSQVLKMSEGNVVGFDPGSLASRGEALKGLVGSTACYMSARASGATSVNSFYGSTKETA